MRNKRGLSLLLCLLLLWLGAVALAEEGVMVASPGEPAECTHAKTTIVKTTVRFEFANDNEHAHFYTSETVCDDCKTVIAADTEGTWENLPHQFDANGFCAVCEYQCLHIFGYEDGVCKNCRYVCTHPGTINGEEREQIDHYLSEGYDYHTEYFNIVADRICSACKTVLEKDVLVRGGHTRGEKHTFGDDGLCVSCGQEPCTHPDIRTSQSTPKHVYAVLDEKYHTDTYDVVAYERCMACGKIFSESVVETGHVDKLQHSYSEDGVCWACQYQTACTHEHVQTIKTYESWKDAFEYVDETYHRVCYDIYGATYCLDCGKMLETDVLMQENVLELKMHGYNENDENGICVNCGAKNTCQHPGTRTETYFTGRNEPVDETYCMTTGNRVTETYCTVCGMRIKKEETPGEGVKEKHSFYAGRCDMCGYEPACAHEKTYIESEKRYYTRAVPKDDKVHLDYYNLYEVTRCAACEKRLSEQLVEKNCEEPVAHWDDAKCVCGYINTCKHENVKTEYYDSDGMCAAQIDDKTHYLEWDSGSYDVCADCGRYLGNEQIIEHVKIVQTHDYEDGVCYDCGYVNDCQHANTYTEKLSMETASRKLDSKYHMELLNWYERVRCADCGEELSRKLIQTGDEQRGEHFYNDVGVCRGCGYVNSACRHENTRAEVEWGDTTILSKDASTHTVARDVSKVLTCVDCGKTLQEEAGAPQKETEPHQDDGNGYCWLCDAPMGENACSHANTTQEVYYRCQKVLAADESGHTIKAVKVTQINCADCGYWIDDREEPGQEVKEEHNYELNKCVVCDYKNPCKHEKTHVEHAYHRQYGYTNDEKEHTFKGDLWENTICDVCGTLIAEELKTFDGTFTMEHMYDEGGECVFCGYKAPAEPTPGPTAKPVEEADNDFVPTPEPVPQAMVETLLGAVREAEAEGSTVTVEVVGAQEVMTETEYTALRTLPAQEQILVTLASIGFEDVVEAAMKTLNVTLSESAQTLMTQVSERMAAVPEEERAALEEKLTQYFPVEEVVVDGVRTSYFVIDLRIEVNGVARVERYGFRLDENGEWIFVKLDLQSVAW